MSRTALESDLARLFEAQAEAIDVAKPPAIDAVSVRSEGRVGHSGRVLSVAAAVAVVALVVGGLVVFARGRGPDAPVSTTPLTSVMPSASTELVQSDLFPALPVDDPRNAAATGTYGLWEYPAAAVAVVGRLVDDEMTSAISIEVIADLESLVLPDGPGEPVAVDGGTWMLYRAASNPTEQAAALPGAPSVVLRGDGVAQFLRSGGGTAIQDVAISSHGDPSFSIGALPDGYEAVADASARPARSIAPQIIVPGPANSEEAFVEVQSSSNALPSLVGADGTLRRVDINGTTGWIRDHAAFIVVWPISDDAWATAVAPTTADDALELARSIEFIDEPTWRDRYQVDPPSWPGYTDPVQTTSPTVVESATAEPTTGESMTIATTPSTTTTPTTTIDQRELYAGLPEPTTAELLTAFTQFEERSTIALGLAADGERPEWWLTGWVVRDEGAIPIYCIGSHGGGGCSPDEPVADDSPAVEIVGVGSGPGALTIRLRPDVASVEVRGVDGIQRLTPHDLMLPSGWQFAGLQTPTPERDVELVALDSTGESLGSTSINIARTDQNASGTTPPPSPWPPPAHAPVEFTD